MTHGVLPYKTFPGENGHPATVQEVASLAPEFADKVSASGCDPFSSGDPDGNTGASWDRPIFPEGVKPALM